ncbi:hypothetical protein MUK42_35586 [Musa troglodytarum]|uniref:Uncharacterized protein n=1 Tax=Musa troglodytarum TaxID=320322 RepID=A0A9E7FJG7_9LILI|nr:hypothetical protein MUK42_35586 [Musa troglodytarum]
MDDMTPSIGPCCRRHFFSPSQIPTAMLAVGVGDRRRAERWLHRAIVADGEGKDEDHVVPSQGGGGEAVKGDSLFPVLLEIGGRSSSGRSVTATGDRKAPPRRAGPQGIRPMDRSPNSIPS